MDELTSTSRHIDLGQIGVGEIISPTFLSIELKNYPRNDSWIDKNQSSHDSTNCVNRAFNTRKRRSIWILIIKTLR